MTRVHRDVRGECAEPAGHHAVTHTHSGHARAGRRHDSDAVEPQHVAIRRGVRVDAHRLHDVDEVERSGFHGHLDTARGRPGPVEGPPAQRVQASRTGDTEQERLRAGAAPPRRGCPVGATPDTAPHKAFAVPQHDPVLGGRELRHQVGDPFRGEPGDLDEPRQELRVLRLHHRHEAGVETGGGIFLPHDNDKPGRRILLKATADHLRQFHQPGPPVHGSDEDHQAGAWQRVEAEPARQYVPATADDEGAGPWSVRPFLRLEAHPEDVVRARGL